MGSADLRARPITREGELLETVPGLIVTQHSGEGKANQYFVRGFNLDHGTDFQTRLDGMPVNMPTHAHGQGYTDLNFLIPELVDHLDYQLGVSHAALGDFGSAGGAEFHLRRTLDRPFATLATGANGFARLATGAATHVGAGDLLLGGEVKSYNGPWLRAEGIRKLSGLARYSWTRGASQFSGPRAGVPQPLELERSGSRACGHRRPDLAIRADRLDRRRAHAAREPVRRVAAQRAGAPCRPCSSTASGPRSRSSPTSPTSSTTRSTATSSHKPNVARSLGGNATNVVQTELFGVSQGHGRAANAHGRRRRPRALPDRGAAANPDRPRRQDPRDRHRSLRRNRVAVAALDPHRARTARRCVYVRRPERQAANSGTRNATIASPKVSLIVTPSRGTELYLSGGYGFHSNDARGTVIRVDPTTRRLGGACRSARALARGGGRRARDDARRPPLDGVGVDAEPR